MLKILHGLHVTASERAAIQSIHARGWTSGRTARKSYEITATPQPGVYEVTVVTSERDDWGRPAPRRSRLIVELS